MARCGTPVKDIDQWCTFKCQLWSPCSGARRRDLWVGPAGAPPVLLAPCWDVTGSQKSFCWFCHEPLVQDERFLQREECSSDFWVKCAFNCKRGSTVDEEEEDGVENVRDIFLRVALTERRRLLSRSHRLTSNTQPTRNRGTLGNVFRHITPIPSK